MNEDTKKPIILCCGHYGRAVIYGRVDSDPVPGASVTMYDARMILRWDAQCGGLLGLAVVGPRGDTRITRAVEYVIETKWQEVVSVTPAAAAIIDAWPAHASDDPGAVDA